MPNAFGGCKKMHNPQALFMDTFGKPEKYPVEAWELELSFSSLRITATIRNLA